MDNARQPDLPRPLDDLRRRLIRWRSARTKLGPIPEDLWVEAAGLARVHGVSRVANALGLGYEGLKRRTEGEKEKQSARAIQGPFVEIDTRAISFSGVSVEIERPDGMKMAIRLTGAIPLDLASLVDSFAGKRE
jgi:hypothetical protein